MNFKRVLYTITHQIKMPIIIGPIKIARAAQQRNVLYKTKKQKKIKGTAISETKKRGVCVCVRARRVQRWATLARNK